MKQTAPIWIGILALLSARIDVRAGSNYQTVYQFPYDSGVSLPTSLIAVDSKLYGTSFDGGSIYTLDPNGSGFQVLHLFSQQGHSYPLGKLSTDGSRLYGTTSDLGSNETPSVSGSIYSLNFDGSDFQVLHEFDDLSGNTPRSGVTIVGSRMYGSTYSGGAGSFGSVYSVNLDGSDFQTLHSFDSSTLEGKNPISAITFADSKLYGTTLSGGEFGKGVIYSMNTDGTDFQIIHQFNGIAGSNPTSQLLFDGSTIFGTTNKGGALDYGTVFSIRPDGSDYQVLHQFSGATSYDPLDGATPLGDLILFDDMLYGTNIGWLPSSIGLTGYFPGPNLPTGWNSTVFSIERDGSNFEVLHQFYFGLNEGSTNGGLAAIGNKLYGTNVQIVQSPVVFSITVPEVPSYVLVVVACLAIVSIIRGTRKPLG